MKKFSLLFLCFFSLTSVFGQIEGTWLLAPEAQALAVGPAQGDFSWWSSSEGDVTTRACLFDDKFIFNTDGSFVNEQDGSTWVEAWQGIAEDGCGTPVAPHDGSMAATWSFDATAGTVTLTGQGAHLGLPKVTNDGELTAPADAPASMTYPVVFSEDDNVMTVDVFYQTGYWHYVFVREGTVVVDPPGTLDLTGTWKLAPQAAALGVGPAQGDIGWWSNSTDDVTTRACLFDDKYIFNNDSGFINEQDGSTWLETWQAAEEGCAAPIAPHNGTAATYVYDDVAETITINGTGAYLGIPKPYNGGELTDPAGAPASITYNVTSVSADGNTITLDLDYATGWWRFIMVKEGTIVDPPVEGDLAGTTWKLSPTATSLAVGPAMGDFSWWSADDVVVAERACLYDDQFVFNMDGSFSNIQDGSTWLETWQGVAEEGCGTPVAPHNGSNAATWTYDATAGTVTIDGVGAHLGLAKVVNGGELTDPAAAPTSVTYPVVFTNEGNTMTVDINAGAGYWHFVFEKEGTIVDPPVDVDLTGTWLLAPEATSLAVGPAMGDFSWWSADDVVVAERACLYDDKFVFNMDGSFSNVQDGSTWLETWQGVTEEGCGAPVAPHDGSNAATWDFDETAGTVTITGVGAHLGLAKVYNGGELTDPAGAPASITYPVTFSSDGNRMTVDINFGAGYWHYVFMRDMSSPTTEIVKDLFSFYPNPASTEIRIDSDQLMDEFVIRDITGRILIVRSNPSLNEIIDVSNLATGVYLLESTMGAQKSVKKFVVQ